MSSRKMQAIPCLLYTSVLPGFKKIINMLFFFIFVRGVVKSEREIIPVSYTHLDVYKRQVSDMVRKTVPGPDAGRRSIFIEEARRGFGRA